MNWKDFVKSAAVKTVSDAEAARIDAEARATGRPAFRAPSKSEWMRFVTKDWWRDRLYDSSGKLREQQQSPITDAVLNTGSRIRRGEYMDAFNGLLAGLTEIGQGKTVGGLRGYPKTIKETIPIGRKVQSRPITEEAKVLSLINMLNQDGLKIKRFNQIYSGRPRFTMYRGSGILPEIAEISNLPESSRLNLINGKRFEHYSPYPETPYTGPYGSVYLTVTDVGKYKPLKSGKQGLHPDFVAYRNIKKELSGALDRKQVDENKMIFNQVTRRPARITYEKQRKKFHDGTSAHLRIQSYEGMLPVSYANKHSHIYQLLGRNIDGGFYNGFIDYLKGNPTRDFIKQNPYFYDMAPIQQLVKIMYRHPEFKNLIFPAIKKHLVTKDIEVINGNLPVK